MTHPSILEEIGREYEGDLRCIGIVDQPAIILKNTQTGEKQTLVIGSHAYTELRPATEGKADMTDPFIFDIARLRFEATKQDDGCVMIRWAYRLPAGGELATDQLYHPSLPGGAGGGGGAVGFFQPAYPPGLPEQARPLFLGFEEHVAGLSAHQKLVWLLAAQKEAADA